MKKIFLLLLMIALAICISTGCAPTVTPTPSEGEGEEEPTGDRVVLVELFNTDGCSASALINPIAEDLAQQYGTDQVILLEEAGWGKYSTTETMERFDWYVPEEKHTPFIAFNGLSETFSEGVVGGGGGGGTVTPTPTEVGNIEGYVYVPESRSSGDSLLLRNTQQPPAGYEPLEGAEVTVDTSSKSTTTNSIGYFLLPGIPVGPTKVKIYPPSTETNSQPLIIEVVVKKNTTVSVGSSGSVSLPSESADHWDVTINKLDIDNWPEVKVYVQVVDPVNNSPIVGATSQNFRVEINGYQFSPVTVTQSGGSSSSSSSSALVIDRSGSMYGQPLADAKAAAKTFVGFMNDTDRAEVVSFESYVTVDQPFTSDKQALNSTIDGLVSGNMTALYDGIWQGLDDTDLESNARKAVIAMTDGRENYSTCPGGCYPEGYSCTPDNSYLISHARDLNIPVYTIGLQGGDYTKEEDMVNDARESETDIQQIAQETGGEYFYAPTSADLEHIYVQITQRVQQQYVLTFEDDSGIFNSTLTVAVDYSGIYGEDSIPYEIESVSQAGILCGTVVSDVAGPPVEGSIVEVIYNGSIEYSTTTNSAGRFGIIDISEGRYEIVTSGNGRASSQIQNFLILDGQINEVDLVQKEVNVPTWECIPPNITVNGLSDGEIISGTDGLVLVGIDIDDDSDIRNIFGGIDYIPNEFQYDYKNEFWIILDPDQLSIGEHRIFFVAYDMNYNRTQISLKFTIDHVNSGSMPGVPTSLWPLSITFGTNMGLFSTERKELFSSIKIAEDPYIIDLPDGKKMDLNSAIYAAGPDSSLIVQLDWDDDANAEGYKVFRRFEGDSSSQFIGSTSDNYFYDSSSQLTVGKKVYYQVSAYNIYGESQKSDLEWTVPLPKFNINLVSPENNATDVSVTPTLQWEPIELVGRYQTYNVYAIGKNDGKYTLKTTVENDTSVTVDPLLVDLDFLKVYQWDLYDSIAYDDINSAYSIAGGLKYGGAGTYYGSLNGAFEFTTCSEY